MRKDKREDSTEIATGHDPLTGEVTPSAYDRIGDGAGVIEPGDMLGLFAQGFRMVKTILIGDPSLDKIPCYVGLLIGPSEPVEVETPGGDGKTSMLPTWSLYPINVKTLKPIEQVTHIIIAPAQLHAALTRVYKMATDKDKSAIVGIQWMGMSRTGKGRQLNDFNVAERLVPKFDFGDAPATVAPAAA